MLGFTSLGTSLAPVSGELRQYCKHPAASLVYRSCNFPISAGAALQKSPIFASQKSRKI
jgi:hypothetical protein